MGRSLGQVWQQLTSAFWTGDQAGKRRDPLAELQAQVDAAHQEWLAARAYFESVSDPDLVDHAIYTMEAAQLKYTYLLRQVRHLRDEPLEAGGRPRDVQVGLDR